MTRLKVLALFSTLAVLLVLSCSTPGPAGFFGKRSLHDHYADNITKAGLKESALGRLWFQAAERSLSQPVTVTLPYSETGYFSAERPAAAGLRFKGKRGQQVNVQLTKRPAVFDIYLDLWQPDDNGGKHKLLASADSTTLIAYEVKEDGDYIVRIQPELLLSGEYTLTITGSPSLAFPVPASIKARVASFWGANRDAGARKHEGIDIMVPFRTPLVAAADGTIHGVNENKLGGKVVWLTPHGKDYTLYYAHLDEQLVSSGQSVKAGDTIGLAGTTGNARGGPPHLHFGIYTNGGAINPIAFVEPVTRVPEKITASLSNLGKLTRVADRTGKIYREAMVTPSNFVNVETGSLLHVEAATAGWYRVVAPGDQQGFIKSNTVASLDKPLRTYKLPSERVIYDQPDTAAARKGFIEMGEPIEVLASWKNFDYVRWEAQEGWLLKTML